MFEGDSMIAIMAMLINIVAIMCFSALAIHFDRWWISLFALLFMASIKYKNEESSTEEQDDNI
jgi:hypothetical protein